MERFHVLCDLHTQRGAEEMQLVLQQLFLLCCGDGEEGERDRESEKRRREVRQ